MLGQLYVMNSEGDRFADPPLWPDSPREFAQRSAAFHDFASERHLTPVRDRRA
jgi:hypothetical protein